MRAILQNLSDPSNDSFTFASKLIGAMLDCVPFHLAWGGVV